MLRSTPHTQCSPVHHRQTPSLAPPPGIRRERTPFKHSSLAHPYQHHQQRGYAKKKKINKSRFGPSGPKEGYLESLGDKADMFRDAISDFLRPWPEETQEKMEELRTQKDLKHSKHLADAHARISKRIQEKLTKEHAIQHQTMQEAIQALPEALRREAMKVDWTPVPPELSNPPGMLPPPDLQKIAAEELEAEEEVEEGKEEIEESKEEEEKENEKKQNTENQPQIEDPFLPLFSKLGYQELQKHQEEVISEAAQLVSNIKKQ
eukprot:gb/GECH01012645.1/.p1 GENE.gb/GECH01012645.1/~~gb/GECH01012645.1/.p1  ORF type:complete len:263 (+),score=91.33 gb/GECH01012645.1/:1-789(+)